MDFVQKGQLYEKALSGMETFFGEMKDSLKNFNKKRYPECFQNLMRQYESLFHCIEKLYVSEEQKQQWLTKLADCLVTSAEDMIRAERWKFRRENLQVDCNLFVVTYIIPLVLEYGGEMSEPFAKNILNCWNKAFDTHMEAGRFEQIYGGFRTGIFGISLGGGK